MSDDVKTIEVPGFKKTVTFNFRLHGADNGTGGSFEDIPVEVRIENGKMLAILGFDHKIVTSYGRSQVCVTPAQLDQLQDILRGLWSQ